jgi:hypothetical protein
MRDSLEKIYVQDFPTNGSISRGSFAKYGPISTRFPPFDAGRRGESENPRFEPPGREGDEDEAPENRKKYNFREMTPCVSAHRVGLPAVEGRSRDPRVRRTASGGRAAFPVGGGKKVGRKRAKIGFWTTVRKNLLRPPSETRPTDAAGSDLQEDANRVVLAPSGEKL